jgi:preprotein translocase subunit SecE
MNSKVETQTSALDVVKIVVAVLIVLAAIAAYYRFADWNVILRVGAVIVAVALAAVIALTTEQGKRLTSFVREAQTEIRQVVWPTRQETIQTTGVVIAVVIIAALFLWVFDWVLGGMVRFLMS